MPPGDPTRQPARDLPLDAHLHTDLSPDSNVPIDVYAAAAAERGIAELAITDHVDFDARDPAYEYSTFEDRERSVREAAERWAEHGVAIRFGAELTWNRRWENDIRAHVAAHPYDFTIGSVHDWPDSPYRPERVASWARGRNLAELVEPYIDEVAAGARSGLFDTMGHLDVVKRYLWPHLPATAFGALPELLEPVLEALVESGTALEVNTSGLRQQPGETYPTAATVVRFRELGGERVTTGSDAHRAEAFAFALDAGYEAAAAAGFGELAFRRGTERAVVAIPARFGPNVPRGASL
ncbi:MAG TPA: histidinol-phosphatase HisJ family protein [Candidatus Limnocylindrales bacterium]|nr:histidinol-phosphatase HisJ family protein [Candidatus Limnocylindrales bacterium]